MGDDARVGLVAMIFCRSNCSAVDAFWTNFLFWYAVVSMIGGIIRAAWIARQPNPRATGWGFEVHSPRDASECVLYYAFMWPVLLLGWIVMPKKR